MFKDLNRPEGLYGDVYDKFTGSKKRLAPVQSLTRWESESIDVIMDEINKKLNLK